MSNLIDAIKSGNNIFLTGKGAGTGKSYAIKEYLKYISETDPTLFDNTYVTGSTGIVSIQYDSFTIYKLCGLQLGTGKPEVMRDMVLKRKELCRTWCEMKTLIIDEISMLDIGYFIRMAKTFALVRSEKGVKLDSKSPYSGKDLKDLPFGGIQLVLCGDFLQLPAINVYKEDEITYKHLFQHPIWKQMNLEVVYLTEPKRYTTLAASNLVSKEYIDRGIKFFDILGDIRVGKLTPRVKEFLKKCNRDPKITNGIFPCVLFPTNNDVDSFNLQELKKLKGKEYKFHSIYECSDDRYSISKEEMIKSSLTMEPTLLREGAQVMLLKNNFDLGLCNGSQGIVTGFTEEGGILLPIVKFMNGKQITIQPYTWTQIFKTRDENGIVTKHITRLTQLPIKLSFSISIHKSQGASLDNAYVSLSKCFSPGQIYVALSRCRDMDNLYISDWNPKVFNRCLPDKECIDFYNQIGSTISDTDINKDSTNNK